MTGTRRALRSECRFGRVDPCRPLLADPDDARPGGASRSTARARHHHVPDGSDRRVRSTARGSAADAVEALRETAVAPVGVGGLVGGAVPAAGAVRGPAMAAPRTAVERHVLLAERSLRRPGLARAG